jgi:hypothetical protein
MTDEDARAKLDELLAKPEDDRTPAEKGQITRLTKQLEDEANDQANTFKPEVELSTVDEKLAWVQAHVGAVEKTGTVAFGRTTYKHMQEHGLIGILRPLLAAVGCSVRCGCVSIDREGNHVILELRLTFTDGSGDEISERYYSEGVDQGDKAINKALTNGNKYALQKFFQIPTDKVDDVEGSDEANNQASTRGRKAAAPPVDTEADEITKRALSLASEGKLEKNRIRAYLQGEFGVETVHALGKADRAALSKFLDDAENNQAALTEAS